MYGPICPIHAVSDVIKKVPKIEMDCSCTREDVKALNEAEIQNNCNNQLFKAIVVVCRIKRRNETLLHFDSEA